METIICISIVLVFILGLFIGNSIGKHRTMEYVLHELCGD